MNIERHFNNSKKYYHEYLTVTGLLHFDDKSVFCGQPWILLQTYKEPFASYINKYEIDVTICDYDDYDIGYAYRPKTEEEFFNVLHELINWINDLEHGVASYWDYIRDIKGFFPECGCKKKE